MAAHYTAHSSRILDHGLLNQTSQSAPTFQTLIRTEMAEVGLVGLRVCLRTIHARQKANHQIALMTPPRGRDVLFNRFKQHLAFSAVLPIYIKEYTFL